MVKVASVRAFVDERKGAVDNPPCAGKAVR